MDVYDTELTLSMQKFKETFGDIVPLREMPGSVTNKQLIDAIELCIEKNENLFPEIFGFKNDENNSDIIF